MCGKKKRGQARNKNVKILAFKPIFQKTVKLNTKKT